MPSSRCLPSITTTLLGLFYWSTNNLQACIYSAMLFLQGRETDTSHVGLPLTHPSHPHPPHPPTTDADRLAPWLAHNNRSLIVRWTTGTGACKQQLFNTSTAPKTLREKGGLDIISSIVNRKRVPNKKICSTKHMGREGGREGGHFSSNVNMRHDALFSRHQEGEGLG